MKRVRRSHVFISYAKEDTGTAAEIHAELQKAGLRPWLDLHDLLPGQDWEHVIGDAIGSSVAFVVLLSSRSVSKTGYVQKEIRTALEIAQRRPQGTGFIIPVVLDDCEVPERLKGWQWLDLRRPNSIEKLKSAIVDLGGRPSPSRRTPGVGALGEFDRRLYKLCVRDGRMLFGRVGPKRQAVSQGHILVVKQSIPSPFKKLSEVVADYRQLSSSQLASVLPETQEWLSPECRLQRVVHALEFGRVIGLASERAKAVIHPDYWRLAQLCANDPVYYVLGRLKPVVVADNDELRMIVMPLAAPSEVLASI